MTEHRCRTATRTPTATPAPNRSCSPAGTRRSRRGGGAGDERVQASIAPMPSWKRSRGERLDGLIVRTVPDVHKAVKWNQPFYGHERRGLVPRLPLLHEVPPAAVLPR